MRPTLNITNGDSAVARLQAAGIEGDFLPWRDVLHDGPVPADLDHASLAQCRAAFLAAQGWGDRGAIAREFAARDQTLATLAEREQVTLWFEHDLYDQLQLLQVLDRLGGKEAAAPHPGPVPVLACAGTFYLGEARVAQLRELRRQAAAVTPAQFALARRAWAALRAPTPGPWCTLREADTSALPYLHDAIARLVDEYPSVRDGLSRTERAALTIVAGGETRPREVFAAFQATEPRRFLGDSLFWARLERMACCEPRLLRVTGPAEGRVTPDATVQATEAGRAVLAGSRRARFPAEPVRWIGGVALQAGASWYRDDAGDGHVRLVREAGDGARAAADH